MSLVRAEAAVCQDEKELGVVVLDIASPICHLWHYAEGHLKLADVVRCPTLVGADTERVLGIFFQHAALILGPLENKRVGAGVVLIGRAAVEAEGVVERAENAFGLPTRIAVDVDGKDASCLSR